MMGVQTEGQYCTQPIRNHVLFNDFFVFITSPIHGAVHLGAHNYSIPLE